MAHWNEKDDPVTDGAFPNIREYIPNVDDPYWPADDSPESCMHDEEEPPTDG